MFLFLYQEVEIPPEDAILLTDEVDQKLKRKTRSKEAWLRNDIDSFVSRSTPSSREVKKQVLFFIKLEKRS